MRRLLKGICVIEIESKKVRLIERRGDGKGERERRKEIERERESEGFQLPSADTKHLVV